MTRPLLLSLACPTCGRDALGEGASRVYCCPSCRTARHMADPSRAYPFWYARARVQGRLGAYAPFWRVEGATTVRTEDGAKVRAYGNMRPLGPLYLPAFWTLRAAHHENLTLRYALMDGAPEADPDGEGAVLPGLLAPSALEQIARLTWLAYLDRVADVTGVEAVYAVRSVEYVAVPFLRAGEGWQDGLLGLPYPPNYFLASPS